MSEIEVLKEIMVDDMNPPKYMSKEKQDALKKALLVLERQKELKEWLEKEIKTMEDLERINYTGAFQNDLRILKEVLERVGEQKHE